jgi:hypothetical protein
MTKEAYIVANGLDPRTSYPRCDFCAKKDADGSRLHGTVQLGRWWAHADCAANPENRALLSVQLPLLNYSSLRGQRTNFGRVIAMKHKIARWAHTRLATLRHVAAIRGADLMHETQTEYL